MCEWKWASDQFPDGALESFEAQVVAWIASSKVTSGKRAAQQKIQWAASTSQAHLYPTRSNVQPD